MPVGANVAFNIAIANPGRRAAAVLLRVEPSGGPAVTSWLRVSPASRATVNPASLAPLTGDELSVSIESDELMLVDRTLTRANVRRAETSLAGPSTTWFLRKGPPLRIHLFTIP